MFLTDGSPKSKLTLILAHGAGGAMDTPWMTKMARAIAAHDIRVLRFEFPYMAARREGKKSGAPDREPVLLDAWRSVVGETGNDVFVGGKSMGGRMASMVADELEVAGLVCLGYPFHPPGAPEKLRTKHLEKLKTRTLIVQGERDPFGTRDDVAQYKLSKSIRIEWLEDGDHSFKPRKSSGFSEAAHLQRAADAVAEFIRTASPSVVVV
ncbi:MAG TPA: alpha/beta fold hydrolase [Thermoanaerobaculia bacterium]|nr:alpha/beta fold hydrolase [Thermoanaerobaculia bacterium]